MNIRAYANLVEVSPRPVRENGAYERMRVHA